MANVTYLTAETEAGRQAIELAMRHTYTADLHEVPAAWTAVRLVDGVPVCWVQVDPNRRMAFAEDDARYAFVMNVATREGRRREGHCRALLVHVYARLRAAGISFVVTHGPAWLYRRLGFGLFTYHCGIFATPELIERGLGTGTDLGREELIQIEQHRALQPDLLLVREVRAPTLVESKSALQAAASAARTLGKARILFEHPPAPSCGSRYPAYASLDSPFAVLARACGAEVRVQGADPEGGHVQHADWVKVIDAHRFLLHAMGCVSPEPAIPDASVCFKTEAGCATIESQSGKLCVWEYARREAEVLEGPSWALAQVVLGYQPLETAAAMLGHAVSAAANALLTTLFPPCWRLSRNESWVFAS